jgi:hypothetical protein
MCICKALSEQKTSLSGFLLPPSALLEKQPVQQSANHVSLLQKKQEF